MILKKNDASHPPQESWRLLDNFPPLHFPKHDYSLIRWQCFRRFAGLTWLIIRSHSWFAWQLIESIPVWVIRDFLLSSQPFRAPPRWSICKARPSLFVSFCGLFLFLGKGNTGVVLSFVSLCMFVIELLFLYWYELFYLREWLWKVRTSSDFDVSILWWFW